MTNLSVARVGLNAVYQQLVDRDWAVKERKDGQRRVLEIARGGSRAVLRVKSKRRGDWQTSTRYASETPTQSSVFWILVDLEDEPEFYVVPEPWLLRDIHEVHSGYLAAHGWADDSERGSDHHSIGTQRVSQWHDRWDLL